MTNRSKTAGSRSRLAGRDAQLNLREAEKQSALDSRFRFPATLPEGPHPFPSRTRKLSPPGSMVLQGRLCGRVERRRDFSLNGRQRIALAAIRFYCPKSWMIVID